MKIIIECDNVQELQELARVISSKTSSDFYSPPVSQDVIKFEANGEEIQRILAEEHNRFTSTSTLDNLTKQTDNQETIENVVTLDNQSKVTEDKPVMVEVDVEKYKSILKADKSILKADGTKNYKKVVSDEEIETIKKMQKGGMPLSKICRDLNLNYRTVYDRLNRPNRNSYVRKKDREIKTAIVDSYKDSVLKLYDEEKLSAMDIAERLNMKYHTVASIITRRDGKIEIRKTKGKEDRVKKVKEERLESVTAELNNPQSPIKRMKDLYPPITNELPDEKQEEFCNLWNKNKYSLMECSEKTGIAIELCKRIIHNNGRIKR